MKKGIYLLLSLFLLTSCNSNKALSNSEVVTIDSIEQLDYHYGYNTIGNDNQESILDILKIVFLKMM